MANTVKVKNYHNVVEEAVASAAITPGNFVTIAAAGTVARAGANYLGVKMVAVEDEFQGKSVTEDYAADDTVQLWVPSPGDIVQAVASAAIVAGALIAHAAAGKVVTRTTETDIIGEAVTAAAADGDLVEIRIK